MTKCPENFFDAYIEAALFCGVLGPDDDAPDPMVYDLARCDIEPDTLAKMRAHCDSFYTVNADDIAAGEDDRAGHDFWLTRNGHGAGFWDGDWPEPQATRLTDAAHALGQFDLFLTDDGKIAKL